MSNDVNVNVMLLLGDTYDVNRLLLRKTCPVAKLLHFQLMYKSCSPPVLVVQVRGFHCSECHWKFPVLPALAQAARPATTMQ